MAHQRSTKSRAKSRSPAPLRTPTTPGQFFPPSHFAAAAGVSYPHNRNNASRRDDGFTQTRTPSTPNEPDWTFHTPNHHSSSNASYDLYPSRPPEHSPLPNSRNRRRSQIGDLGLLETQLLPTLSDTIDRMTRPPSQAMSTSPFRPGSAEYLSGVARTPSCSSQSSSAYSGRSEPYYTAQMPMPMVQATSVRQPPLASPSVARPPPEQTPLMGRSTSKPNPKSILKSPHVHSDQHLQVRQTHLEDVRLSSTEQPRKAGRSPIPKPLESIPSESKPTEQQRQAPISPRPKSDNSSRISRARSRTDPGTLPKGLPSNQGKITQQQSSHQPSSIPRRVGASPSPAISRPSTNVTRPSDSGSDAGTAYSAQREKRRLFVTNADIASSSSTDSPGAISYVKQKVLTRTDSQSSAESQLRPPRFGLGLGLSGVNESRGSVVPLPRGPPKTPREESSLRPTNSPNNQRHPRDRSPSSKARTEFAEGQRRHRELISLMNGDVSESSGVDSPVESIPPSGSERSDTPYLASDGSGSSLRSAFDDSGSEYSPTEEHDEEALRRPSTRWENKAGQMRTKARLRQCRNGLPRDDSEPPIQVDDQHTPKALSTPSFFRPPKAHRRGYAIVQSPSEESTETDSSSSLATEEEAPQETQPAPERYSSELSRIMMVSNAAEARQRQAFGIDPPLNVGDQQLGSPELPHSDSNLSSIGDDRWQGEYDELETGSILQQPSRAADSDKRAHREKQSSIDHDSLFSAQTHSSISQESIYSTQNSSTRGSMARESLLPIPTAREQQWQVFERHVLGSYGEIEAQRQRLVWELVESEDNFVMQLQNMVHLFISPLRVRDTRMWVSGIPSDVAKLFDWLDDIVRVHAQLSSALTSRQIVDHPRLQAISEVFRCFIPRLETYQPYLVKLEFVASVIDSLMHEGKDDFGDFIRLQEASERCQGWTLEKYLIEPVNRLARYPEVFRRLLQLTPKSHPDYMSTLSLYHAAKLTIRVLSEVKDREDAYELVKMACSGIKGIPSNHLTHRERRLLIRGSLTCVEVSNDDQIGAFEPALANQSPSRTEVPPDQRARRSEKLSKAVDHWRGRSNSIKSTASTVVSFGTASSSFDVHLGQRAMGTPVVRVESEQVEVEVFVFTDMMLLVSPSDPDRHHGDEDCDLVPLERFGLSRLVSVLDEMDRRACITLDLSPLTTDALEAGRVHSSGPVVTISLSRRPRNDKTPPLSEWLSFLRQSCQYTLRSLSSFSPTSVLVNGAAADADAQKPVLSLLAAGLPFPKSPSMQIEEFERGWGSDSEQQEREERGWWSKRFHEVFLELSRQQDVLQC